MGRPLKLTDQGTTQDIITGTTYGPAGELLTMSGTVNESRGYNSLLQLTAVVSGSVNLQYTYSATQNNGKIQSQTDAISGEQITYTYDALLRLASATSNQAWNQSFSYDGFGNLTDVNGTSPMHTTFNPANNRPNGSVADANGNNTAVGTYDVENRLVWAGVLCCTTYGTYGYAPDNKRVWRGIPGSPSEFTLWGVNGQKLTTFNINPNGDPIPSEVGAPSTTNVWFGGRLALKNGSAVSVDNLSSRGKYYPYGGERGSSNPANGQEKFATYTRDAETGLDYADQRYYQPGTGMFLSPDPYQASGGPGDPGSWNRYAYVGGDPINFKDPQGLIRYCPVCDIASTPAPQIGFLPPEVFHPISEAYWDSQPYRIANRGLDKAQTAAGFLATKTTWSQQCSDTLAQAGISPKDSSNGLTLDAVSQLQMAASQATFFDGRDSPTLLKDLYTNSSPPGLANLIDPTKTVGDVFGQSPSTHAMASLGGNQIYISPVYFNGIGSGFAAAVVMHELLHNITGLTDPDLERNLGLTGAGGSIDITLRLAADCLL